jgi:hypothetical protein
VSDWKGWGDSDEAFFFLVFGFGMAIVLFILSTIGCLGRLSCAGFPFFLSFLHTIMGLSLTDSRTIRNFKNNWFDSLIIILLGHSTLKDAELQISDA